MNPKNVFNRSRRMLAFLLAMIMTFSVVDGAAVTAFAQTDNNVVITEVSDDISETPASEIEETTVSSTEEVMTESVIEASSIEATSEAEVVSTESSEATEELPIISPTKTKLLAPHAVATGNATYTGEVSEDGTTLTVSENGVVAAGGTFDDATIIDILTTRANASERYSTVVIEYNSIKDVVSESLWNAFVSIGANTAVVCFDGGSNPDERWSFYSPSASDGMGDASLAVDISVREDGNVAFSREYTNYSCSGGAILELYLDDVEAQAEWFEIFKAAYGEESLEYVEIRDEDNNERSSEYGAAYYYSDEECVLAIDFGDTYGSTTFSLHKPYMGHEYTEEDGRSVFVIDEWIMPSNKGINTSASSILEANSNKYDVIQFNYTPDFEDKCTGYVVMQVWNAACSLLNESTEDSPSQIRVNFCGGATEPDTNWCIDNPQPINDSSVFLGASLTPSTEVNGGATLVIEDNSVYHVTESNASVSFNVDENGRKELFDSFVNAYGTKFMHLELLDGEGNLVEAENLGGAYEYNTEEENKNVNIGISGVTQLNCYSPYSVVEHVYKGDYNEHEQEDGYLWQELFLHPGNMDKDSFTADDISKILSNHEEKSFDAIVIATMSEDMAGSVSANAINAALPYLKEATEERASIINLAFKHPTNENGIDWQLINPQSQEEDQTLSCSLSIVDDSAVLSLGNQSLAAGCVNLSIYRNNEKDADGVAVFKSVFGENSTHLALSNSDVSGYLDYNDYEALINIEDISRLKANTEYELSKSVYKGHINTWDDGRRELWIGFGEAGVESFSETDLNAILDKYSKEDNIQFVYIEQPSDVGKNMIYKSVADKAAALINADNNGYGEVKFAFRNPHTDQCIEWQLGGNPSAIVQTKDQEVKANFILDEENNGLFVSFIGHQGLVAPEVRVCYFANRKNENETSDEFIINLLGEKELQLETEDGETPGWYWTDEHTVCVGLGNPRALDEQSLYKVVKKAYRGDVWEDTDEEGNVVWTTLYLNSIETGNDTFTATSFKEAISYYTEREVKFDNVIVEQRFTTNNVINKDILNAARELLTYPEEQQLEFRFCRCVDEERDDENNIKQEYSFSDMQWIIAAPGIATKNINANVTLKSVGNGGSGVSVVLPTNTYNADFVHVEYHMDENAYTYKNVLYPNFEQANPWTENVYDNELIVLEKGTTLSETARARYGINEEGNISLILPDVNEWKAGIDNRIVEPYYMEQLAVVGKPIALPIFHYNPNDPDDPNAPGEDVTNYDDWNNPHKATQAGTFKLLTSSVGTLETKEDATYFTATTRDKMAYTLYTYTSVSGEKCLEVLGYQTAIGILGLSFADKDENGEITIEWTPEDDEPSNEEGPDEDGFLKVNVKPASIQDMVNPQNFEWYVNGQFISSDTISGNSVSGNSIVLNKYEWRTSYWDEETGEDVEVVHMLPNGCFDIVGYGSTTVTVRVGEEYDTCVINVIEPVQLPHPENWIPSIFAIPAIDSTLADLGDLDKLIRDRYDEEYKNYTGTFSWKDDSISLAPYANMEYAEFGAIYKEADGREVPVLITVDMLRITEIGLYSAYICEESVSGNTVKDVGIDDLNNTTVLKGEDLVMGYQVGINRPQFDEDGLTDEFATFARYIEEGKLIFKWNDKETLTLIEKDKEHPDDMTIDANVYNNGRIQKPRSYTATSKGKKIFTVEAVNLLTNKVIFKNSATVIVNEKPLFDFNEVAWENIVTVETENEKAGKFVFTLAETNYKNAGKLTFTSTDKSVLKLGSVDIADPVDGQVVITVPYEFKKHGKTVLKVTAKDEVKSTCSYDAIWIDYAPTVSKPSYTIDKAWMYLNNEETGYRSTEIINFAFQHDTMPAGTAIIKDEASQKLFKLNGDVDAAQYWIELADSDLDKTKNKTYTVTLEIPYTVNGDEANVRYSEQTIKVKVTQSKVKVTAKQTKKINTFYDSSSEEGAGIVTLKTPSQLLGLTLNNDSAFEYEVLQTNGYDDFELSLKLKDGQNIETLTKEQKNITLNYKVRGNSEEVFHVGSVVLKVKEEKKAPSLVIPKNSDTLYPNMGIDGTSFVVMNKTTGELVELNNDVSLVINKKQNITQPINNYYDESYYESIKVGKNDYYLENDDYSINYYLYDSSNAVKATDKFTLRIQKDHWNGYVDVTYSAKVELKKPALKLDKKTLTINANEEVYRYQTDYTHINVTGYAGTMFDEVWFTGANKTANDALKNNLSLSWNRDESKISVSIVNKGNETDGTLLKAGNYKFKVYTMLNGQEFSTNLTVKVVAPLIKKSVKVTKKGSIDVLRRDTTQITMNPKLSSLTGFVHRFELTGPDADLFNYYYDWETGNCVVQACGGFNYSTKVNYNVTPVYYIQTDNGEYKVDGAPQKIKVTQGKPKVSIWSNTSTLYGDKSIGALLGFDAAIKDEYVGIKQVELLNYTNDLDWEWEPLIDSEGNFTDDCENGEPMDSCGRLTINGNTPKDITKASGKYTLKFVVTYWDAAGNEKATQIKYKLNIVR